MKKLALYILLLLIAVQSFGQNGKVKEQRQQFYKVLNYMYEEKYDAALDILYHLDSVKLTPFVKNASQRFFVNDGDTVTVEKIYVKYLIAACYFEDQSKTQKPLEYIEFVMNSGYSKTPEIVYKDLGDLYHRDYQFDKAIFYYRKFLQETDERDFFYDYVQRKVEVSKNAQAILKDTIDAPIFQLNENINTPYSEQHPLISNDHSLLVFDYTEYKPSATDQKSVKKYAIKACHKELGIWQKARELQFTLPDEMHYYRLAGLSPDGSSVFLAIASAADKPKNLYKADLKGTRLTNLNPLDKLNSSADENFIALDTDGETAYLSSNREGGKGRYDIYKSEKNSFNNWKAPENLGDAINTPLDEINPFLHPDTKMLYFSSNGHENLGGLDVFYSAYHNGKWQKPVNMGFPINTVVDNYSVSINPKLNKVYFSLEKTSDFTNHDIFSTSLDTGIPYTALNGLLVSDDKNSPVTATIKVAFLNQDKEDIIISRQPNEEGHYLIFFPPGNDYKMLIEAEGYKTRVIKFRVPEQNYYFQLRQRIMIEPINLLGEKVGERFELQNYFQDIPDDTTAAVSINALKSDEEKEKMQEVVERIMEYKKQMGDKKDPREEKYGKLLNFIDKSIDQTDTTALRQLKKKANYDNQLTDNYYYKKNAETTSKKVTIDGKTYNVDHQIDLTDESLNAREVTLDNLVESNTITPEGESSDTLAREQEAKKEIARLTVLFENNKHEIKDTFRLKLKEVANFLLDNDKLKVSIHGYANDLGTKRLNYELSKKRALAVKEFLQSKRISKERMTASYHGELKTTSPKDLKENRKTEVIITSQ